MVVCQVSNCSEIGMNKATGVWAHFNLQVNLCPPHHVETFSGRTTHDEKCECSEVERFDEEQEMKKIKPKQDIVAEREGEEYIIATTGHREPKVEKMYDSAISFVKYAKKKKALVLNGGAPGWDTIVAHYCVKMGVRFILVLPYRSSAKQLLSLYTEGAEEIIVYEDEFEIPEGTPNNVIPLLRNNYMVDTARELHSYYDKRLKGGTKHTVNYAKKKRVPMKNWYPAIIESLI